jgi:hypothetical protein
MMEHSKPTQAQRVLQYMERFGSITQFEALKDLGVMRLASRISELRKNGYAITGEMVNVENRFGETCQVKRYTIKKDGESA